LASSFISSKHINFTTVYAQTETVQPDILTREEAKRRAEIISNVSYNVSLDFIVGDENFISESILLELVTGEITMRKLVIDTDRRWQIVNALASKGFIDETFIDNEFELDPTDMVAKNAEKAKISMPIYKNKFGA